MIRIFYCIIAIEKKHSFEYCVHQKTLNDIKLQVLASVVCSHCKIVPEHI